MEQSREKFASRLGFILISAGCAIGLGNVYRFPIITGAYGGGVFVLIYIAFLVLLIKSIISIPSSLMGMKIMLTEYGFKDALVNMYPSFEAALTKVAEFSVTGGSFNMLYNISSLVSWVVIFIFATLSNYFYYKNVISKGSRIKKSAAASGINVSEALKSAGGTSAALLVTFIVLYFLSTYAVMAAILLIV